MDKKFWGGRSKMKGTRSEKDYMKAIAATPQTRLVRLIIGDDLAYFR